jgi:O-antigen/teichoic acid export membrane protein
MDARTTRTSPAELASETSGLLTGLGVLSVMFFPVAVPGLVLGLALALPLVLLAVPAPPIWLFLRGVSRMLGRARPASAGNPADAPRQASVRTGTA